MTRPPDRGVEPATEAAAPRAEDGSEAESVAGFESGAELGAEPGAEEAAGGRRGRSVASVVFVVVALAVAFLAGLVVGRSGEAEPNDRSAEAGFARDMAIHHAQAVDMAFTIMDRTDDETLRTVARDIALTQQDQIGQMYGWLAQWDLTVAADVPPMTWMGDDHDAHATTPPTAGGPIMPGMATAQQMTRLRQLSGAEAERMFLQLMIAHHRGGIDMAEAILRRTERPEVRLLAESIRRSQRAEIAQLERLLAAVASD